MPARRSTPVTSAACMSAAIITRLLYQDATDQRGRVLTGAASGRAAAEPPHTPEQESEAERCEGLRTQHADDLANGFGGRRERLLLVVRVVELDDLLDPVRAELHGDSHVEVVDPVLALEICGAREHALLFEHD